MGLATSTTPMVSFLDTASTSFKSTTIGTTFVLVLALKCSLGVFLVSHAGSVNNQELIVKRESDEKSSSKGMDTFLSRLQNIERYTLWKGRVLG
jgi:hypothetical protein